MNFLSIKDHFENMIQILFPHDFRVYDGTEIHEASSCCVAITRLGKKVVFYAPDKTAHHEVNHVTGKFLAKLLISDGLGSKLQGFVQNETLKNTKYIFGKKKRGIEAPFLGHKSQSNFDVFIFPIYAFVIYFILNIYIPNEKCMSIYYFCIYPDR